MMAMPTLTQRLANPTRFMELSGAAAAVDRWRSPACCSPSASYMAFTAPPDYQQGHTAKIMFVHVPCGVARPCSATCWSRSRASACWCSAIRWPTSSAKAAAPIGAVFTFLCLVTGSLWGKPMWGAFWVWDPRLTSVLILFLLYLGLIALRSSIEDEALAAKLTAVLSLVGIVILPVIKFSVDWNSLHQPASVMRLGAPTIHPSLLWPLLVMALGMTVLFAALHLKAMRNEILRRRVKALRMVEVEASAGLARQAAR